MKRERERKQKRERKRKKDEREKGTSCLSAESLLNSFPVFVLSERERNKERELKRRRERERAETRVIQDIRYPVGQISD